MKTKTIKVIYTSRYSRKTYKPVPKIQIEGNWIEALGFHTGESIQVEYEEGSIHIRTLTAEELNAIEQQELQAELNHKIIELNKLKSSIKTESARLLNAVESKIPCASSSQPQPQPSMICEPKAPFTDKTNSRK